MVSPPTLTHSDGRPTEGLGETSRWVDLDGPVHWVDHGGPAGAEQIVLVHGLGGSHANWTLLARLLTPTHRVVALDLAGFGLTVGGPRSATVRDNAALLGRFLAEVTDSPVTLVGNSMGGLISALVTMEHPELVRRLVLVDPALPVPVGLPDPGVVALFGEPMLPKPIQRWIARRRGPQTIEQITVKLLKAVAARPIPDESLREHERVARARAGDRGVRRDFAIAWRSLRPFIGLERRSYRLLLKSIDRPVLLLHGERDRLVNVRAAKIVAKANPHWDFRIARGVGHVPQLEDPGWTAEQILGWARSTG